MAGLSWFELDVNMPDDPKCIALGARLKNPLAFAYVVRLYAYCYRHEQDTFVGLGAPGTIEDACRWKGKTGALLAALLAEGFVDHTPAATYTIHGVGKRLTSAVKRREDAADRKRRWRETHGGPDACGTRDGTRDETVTHNRPNQTRPNQTDQVIDQRDDNEHDATRRTPFERLRIEVSSALCLFGSREIVTGSGRTLGEQIRNANAAIEKHGFDVVRDACVTHAQSSGQTPETMTFFARTLAGLAEGEPPKKKRQPGENPTLGDPDYDRPDAWWSLSAFNARERRSA